MYDWFYQAKLFYVVFAYYALGFYVMLLLAVVSRNGWMDGLFSELEYLFRVLVLYTMIL